LVKLPVALSALMTENSDPVAGAKRSIRPVNFSWPSASTVKVTLCPGCMPTSWVSLKLATTQT
jgi:hypothetical protein